MSNTSRTISHKTAAILLLAAVDVLFFSCVSPASNLFVVVVGCVLLALTAYALVSAGVSVASHLIPLTSSTRKRLKLFATVLVVFYILMQSIGQLSGRDILASLPLAAGTYFYLAYNDSRRDKRDDKART